MTCKQCKREQRSEHLTSDGLCVFCEPVATWPAKWVEQLQRDLRKEQA